MEKQITTLLKEFCEYSTFIRGYSRATIDRYDRIVKLFIKFLESNNVKDITDNKVKQFFFYGRVERNWSASSFVTYHKSLLVFFRWLVELGYLENNYIEDIELPRIEKKLPLKLTKQEVLYLLEFVYNYPYQYRFLRYRNHAIFSTFIFAGLRKNELLNLGFGDVDLENRTLFVHLGKGNKDRILPISVKLSESLEKYVKERFRLRKTCPQFFVSLNRDMGFTEDGLKHLVNKIKKESKIKFGVHKLRHTFATLMLEGGCDIYSLSKMMGHSDIKTTTIYLAASAEHLRNQIFKHPLN